jgi:hypothetical protein
MNTSIEITGKIVELLTPLESEARMRVIQAALMLLGETLATLPKEKVGQNQDGDVGDGFPTRARSWMKHHSLSTEHIQQVFHVTEGNAEIIAAVIPGKNKKEQTFNAYIFAGLAKLLSGGEPAFDDKSARALCESSGCYDSANHAAYMKNKGNEFTGSKDKGWTLTTPGLKRGAELVKELNK